MTTTQKTNPPSFDSVQADLPESRKETQEFKESLNENERIMKEGNDEFYEKLGDLTTVFGKMTEDIFIPRIWKKFNEIGFCFLRAGRSSTNDKINDISFDVDIMLENYEKAMLISVKNKLTLECINYHLGRLEKMRKYADLNDDKRIFLGQSRVLW